MFTYPYDDNVFNKSDTWNSADIFSKGRNMLVARWFICQLHFTNYQLRMCDKELNTTASWSCVMGIYENS